MVILLYGPDSYRRLRKLKDIAGTFEQKNPTASIGRFNLDPTQSKEILLQEIIRFKEFVGTRSIFADKQLAILENVWSSASGSSRRSKAENESASGNGLAQLKELKNLFKSYLAADDLTILISDEKTPPANFNFLLKAPVKHEKFEALKGASFSKFIKKEASELGIDFSREALDFLVKAFESNTWGLMTELQKLQWIAPQMSGERYQVSGGRIIGFEEIKKFGDYTESQDISEFMNAVRYGDGQAKRLLSLEKLFLAREDSIKIFNIFQSWNHYPELLTRLADYDIMVKSGKMEYDDVLLDLALS